ncbi:MAG: hypothetical protein ACRD19_01640, partial [Terriglobia bacterium]
AEVFMENELSRRGFLEAGAAAAGLALFDGSARAQAAVPPDRGATKLSQSAYRDVELLEGPALEQFNASHAFFLAQHRVNLFIPSRLRWQQNGLHFSLAQQTQYPYASEIAMHIRADRPETFTISLRVPEVGRKKHFGFN